MQLLLQDLLHLLKVLVQVGSGSSKQLTGADVLNRVRTLSGSSDDREDKYVYVSEALLAGIASGAVESLVRSPFELIKLRAQVTSASQIPSSASVVEKAVVSPLMEKLLPGYSGNIRALNNTVGLLTTLPTKHSNLVTALKDYPWMMTGSGRPQSVSDVKRLLEIISLEGWGAFWRGMRSGLARDCVFGGIFFSTWQFLHQAMLERKAVGMNTPPSC